MLALLIGLPLLGGLLTWWLEGADRAVRWVALGTLALTLVLLAVLWGGQSTAFPPTGAWLAELDRAWIPRFGIRFHLGLDGLSLVLIALTLVLGLVGVVASWTEIRERVGFFHFHLLWTVAGVVGVFLALDLFLFFFLWEVMLVPMYFVIALWGHEDRGPAAVKFFIFTQGSGLLLLLGILALVFLHHDATGTWTFDYLALRDTTLDPGIAFWAMLGLFLAFAVKLPVVPVHTWLPDAHTQAPTAGSVLLAGILLKTGAYGLLRFAIPLFPEASLAFAPVALGLGVASILYGAVQAFAQDDVKRLVAYSSISHMGFVLVGLYAWNTWALQGVVMQMVAHGLSTGALFLVAGLLQERLHTRSMERMGGLWGSVPRLSAFTLLFVVASLGLPGLANFVGELLVLLGAFGAYPVFTVLAALGLVGSLLYTLILVQKALHGPPGPLRPGADLTVRETCTLAVLAAGLVWLGLAPQPVFDLAGPALASLQQGTGTGATLNLGAAP
ncbi:NADH dehydrogenase subunit M [Thiohalorhabdus denitrificans]|uniref:NADH-quinone oxidoreductase subunit M n=2 Tax=Thiohalorhabdus denitrificans TaxID=381306 RepID=A0A1G5HEI2_9GAMM|nr:NADH dehydrogenase subunit M [Thiohalorhabdus denitrificans]